MATGNRAVKIAVAGWALFGGSHLVMSHPPVRSRLIETLGGEAPFRTLYSGIAVASVAGTLALYSRQPLSEKGRLLHTWATNKRTRYASVACKTLSSICIVDALVNPLPNPLQLTGLSEKVEESEFRRRRNNQIVGMQRITRHGMAVGTGLYGIANVLVRGRLADVILWGTLPIFGMIACLHQEQRLRLTKPAFVFDETSFWPFWAMVEGKQSLGKAYATGFCVACLLLFWP